MTVATVPSNRFRDLPRPGRRLLRLMQGLHFGRVIFNVRRGEPDLGRPWRTRRTVKLAGEDNGPRPEARSADFKLRKEHMALFDEVARLRDGACVTIEVKYGLPFIIEIEQDHQVA